MPTTVNMDALRVTSAMKVQLQEVANLMLEVYRTLERMRYLQPECINPGPHGIESFIPMYRSHGIDDSIIYLYNLLPYIDLAHTDDVAFIHGSSFIDFRKEDDVQQGRDPFYSEEPGDLMLPYMTPLSQLGNHQSCMVYSAQSHEIWIIDQEGGGSTDHGLWVSLQPEELTSQNDGSTDNNGDQLEEIDQLMVESDEESKSGSDDSQSDKDHEPSDTDNDMSDTEEEQEESDQEEIGQDDSQDDESESQMETGRNWLESGGRPAGDVLRDIVKWYRDLTETPGGGEHCGLQWDRDIVKPLYRKHGWPGPAFDGDAFLMDQARAYAASHAKYTAEQQLGQVRHCKNRQEFQVRYLQASKDEMAAATTTDDEWIARRKVHQWEEAIQLTASELEKAKKNVDLRCPGGVAQKPQDLPLWELEEVKEKHDYAQKNLKEAEKAFAQANDSDQEGGERSLQIKLVLAQRNAQVMKNAYESCKRDAERLRPGVTFKDALGYDYCEKKTMAEIIQETFQEDESYRDSMVELRAWMAKIPEDAEMAKGSIEREIENFEKRLIANEERRIVLKGLKDEE